VIVDNLYVIRSTTFESKADSPLLIDSNAPLITPVAAQSFQPIARWPSQEVDGHGRIEHRKLALRLPAERVESSWTCSAE